jgi:hypothetical protein
MIERNMGAFDRSVRALMSTMIALWYFSFYLNGLPGVLLVIFAWYLTITSAIAFDPLYWPFNYDTYDILLDGPEEEKDDNYY